VCLEKKVAVNLAKENRLLLPYSACLEGRVSTRYFIGSEPVVVWYGKQVVISRALQRLRLSIHRTHN
jgi:hypothetical protein